LSIPTTSETRAERDEHIGQPLLRPEDTLAALGAYLSNFAPSIPGNSYLQTVTGLYRTPSLHLRVRDVYTNTVPVDAYRAADLPLFNTAFIASPAPSNPLGVKGGSESGMIGVPAAIGNAVIDALWHLGVRDITLPIRPEKVWRALRAAKNTRSLQ
jgi:CO/xanthine dehydrogenase Mo-binding subunit